ncbi:MAG: primosomal protein N', partial [Hyphomicrobiaceae bacterium]|nr:primosomal protein N' [Hyphomicrobiaceae bacterium]
MAKDETIPVLLPLALEAPYDYLALHGKSLSPGDFVAVPLGTRERIGVVWKDSLAGGRERVDAARLRTVLERLEIPPLPLASLKLVEWVANYTISPPGMVLRMMMSAKEAFTPPKPQLGHRLTGTEPARMTQARSRVLEAASNGMLWAKRDLMEAAGVGTSVINGLVDIGTLSVEPIPPAKLPVPDPDNAKPDLTKDQA